MSIDQNRFAVSVPFADAALLNQKRIYQ